MGQDRRLGVDRRNVGNRRSGADHRGYNGPEKRSIHDRRSYSERRQERYIYSESSIFQAA